MSYPQVKLGECAKILSGSTPQTNNPNFWDGSIIWVTPKDLSKLESKFIFTTEKKITQLGYDSCSTQLLPENSVLFSSRAPIGHVAINTVPMCTNQGFKSFVPIPNLLDANFLYFWLKANKAYLQDLGVGATFKEISKSIIEKVEIPLPPLEEQRRIAEILDKADSLIQKRKAAIAKLDELLQATFIDMFGDPVTNPKGWENCIFENLIELVTYGLTVRPEYHEKGIPLISAREIRTSELNFDSSPKISKVDFDKLSAKAKPKKNDILFSKTGSIGHCAIVRDEKIFAITQNVARITPKKNICNPIFLLYFMRTTYFYNLANKEAKGNAVKDLQLGIMKKFTMYLPFIELQDKWAEFAKAVEEQKTKNQAQLEMQETLFKSLQQQAFSGQL